MHKLWDNSKLVINYEDVENEKLVRQTLSNLRSDASDEELENVAVAINSLSELPVDHIVVTDNYRHIF